MSFTLRDLSHKISTVQPVRVVFPSGESIIPKIYIFDSYGDYIVKDIWVKNGELNIEISEPEEPIKF